MSSYSSSRFLRRCSVSLWALFRPQRTAWERPRRLGVWCPVVQAHRPVAKPERRTWCSAAAASGPDSGRALVRNCAQAAPRTTTSSNEARDRLWRLRQALIALSRAFRSSFYSFVGDPQIRSTSANNDLVCYVCFFFLLLSFLFASKHHLKFILLCYKRLFHSKAIILEIRITTIEQ